MTGARARRSGVGSAARLGTGIPGCLILLAWMVAPQRVAWTLLDLPALARWLGAAGAALARAALLGAPHPRHQL